MLYSGYIPVYFTPVEEYYVPEIFVDITSDKVPGILDYYMISNYGRIWHKHKAKILSTNLDSKGYPFKPLATINGNQNFRIHRLVGLFFLYFPGCENYVINHIDGIKTNNYFKNLEWVTQSDNVVHAYNLGLNKAGKYNKIIVIKICEMLQAGDKTFEQISNELGVSYQLIQAINQKRVYRYISDNYVFPQRKVNTNFSEDQVRAICQYIVDHPKPLLQTLIAYYREILFNVLKIENPSKPIIRTVEKIYNKLSYSYISKDYAF